MMLNDHIYWILKGRYAFPCKNIYDWAFLGKTAERHKQIADTYLYECRISTVFLGINHSYSNDGPPLLFETMIFGGKHDGLQCRCSTYLQAERGHAIIVEAFKLTRPLWIAILFKFLNIK